MAISPKLEFRQAQTLVMTPQLQQAIKLLQLSNIELTAYVDGELERNPILERVDDSAPAGEAGPADNGAGEGDADGAARQGDSAATELGGDNLTAPVQTSEAPLDTDYANEFTNDSPADAAPAPTGDDAGYSLTQWGATGGGGYRGDDDFSFEQVLSRELTLKEHLREQLQLANIEPAQRLIGAELIETVDEAGYISDDSASVAERLGCSVDDVEAVLTRLQQFDPTGVCARSLTECLSLQLRERDRFDPAMQAMIDRLDLVAAMDVPGLVKACGVDDEDVRDMLAELKSLDPKPGLAYDQEVSVPVIPDVFVRPKQDGGWSVELNNDTLPRLLLNRHYYTEVSRRARNREEKSYLSECLQSANWLMKSLDQRARTILKVSTELVRQQDGFLAHGVQHLRPLNLRTIADAVDIHESTVSRVTANKYMATPRGIFELKYFFTSALASAGGEDVSSEAVRQQIRAMIDAETADKVLSDDKLVERLRNNGVEIARRTVAKYREGMGIPSSVQRRRMKRLSA